MQEMYVHILNELIPYIILFSHYRSSNEQLVVNHIRFQMLDEPYLNLQS